MIRGRADSIFLRYRDFLEIILPPGTVFVDNLPPFPVFINNDSRHE
jgi:hypothetical protein